MGFAGKQSREHSKRRLRPNRKNPKDTVEDRRHDSDEFKTQVGRPEDPKIVRNTRELPNPTSPRRPAQNVDIDWNGPNVGSNKMWIRNAGHKAKSINDS